MARRYRYSSGIRELAATMRGDERVHAGARPYGLHSGNRLPLIVYPALLAQALRRRGVAPTFQYTVSLNDWGTDMLEHPAGHELNLVPRGTTFQYQDDPQGCHATRVDHWEAVIDEELGFVRETVPEAEVSVIRVSTLRAETEFQKVLLHGIDEPEAVAELARKTLGVPVLERPLQWAGAACRRCNSIDGVTSHDPGRGIVSYRCNGCHGTQASHVSTQDYWFYVHLLGAAKNAALRPDIWIFGGDFLRYGTSSFHNALYEQATGAALDQAQLFTVILLGPDGRKMSKSDGNLAEVPLNWLMETVAHWDSEELPLPAR